MWPGPPNFFTLLLFLCAYFLRALLPDLVNKVLFEHSRAHLVVDCLWWLVAGLNSGGRDHNRSILLFFLELSTQIPLWGQSGVPWMSARFAGRGRGGIWMGARHPQPFWPSFLGGRGVAS